MAETSKTVRNALQLLSCFSRAKSELSASELARQLKLPRTNVIRLLATLEAFGFVERATGNALFRVGLRAFEIGSLYLAANPTSSLLRNALDELVQRTKCTAYLAVLDKEDIVMLTCREGSLPIRFIWQVGDRLPSYTTSLGKAMLMHMTREEIDKQIGTRKNLRTLTERSLRTRDALDRDLQAARRRGWGLAREESHPGLTAVGAAILDQRGRPIAAISISYFDHPPQSKRLEGYAEIVTSIANDVTRKIAGRSGYDSALGPEVSRDIAILPAEISQHGRSTRGQNPAIRSRTR